MDQAAVLERVVAWCRREENVRVAVLTGSVARNTHDVLSDLDIELYVSDPIPLLGGDAWYRQFGQVLVVEALDNPGWHPTRLVYYADGKIDFMIAPMTVFAGGVSYERSFRVLLDKDGLAHRATLQRHAPRKPPTAEEFLRCVHWFWAAAIMWAKLLARDDPWSAKIRDRDSKCELLRMLEWDHRARKGWDYDTWFDGAQLRAWIDPELMPRIDACWSGLGFAESARALGESMTLFDMLSTRTATRLGLAPFDAREARRSIESLLAIVSVRS